LSTDRRWYILNDLIFEETNKVQTRSKIVFDNFLFVLRRNMDSVTAAEWLQALTKKLR
jgi:hypothetical protein